MQGYQKKLHELLVELIGDTRANSQQKVLARQLVDTLDNQQTVKTADDPANPPEGSGN